MKLVKSMLLIAALTATNAHAAEPEPGDYKPNVISTCEFPLGKYKYLFSDGMQTYYFSKDHTIYVSPDGKQFLKKGDFKLSAKVSTYQRIGDKFIYTNPAGTYTSENGGPIDYKPSPVAAQIAAFTPSYTDKFGSYKKSGGKIIFTPAKKLPDLEVSESNCGMLNVK